MNRRTLKELGVDIHKDEIAARGGLPRGMTILSKPVSFATLEGYVNAKETARAKAS